MWLTVVHRLMGIGQQLCFSVQSKKRMYTEDQVTEMLEAVSREEIEIAKKKVHMPLLCAYYPRCACMGID